VHAQRAHLLLHVGDVGESQLGIGRRPSRQQSAQSIGAGQTQTIGKGTKQDRNTMEVAALVARGTASDLGRADELSTRQAREREPSQGEAPVRQQADRLRVEIAVEHAMGVGVGELGQHLQQPFAEVIAIPGQESAVGALRALERGPQRHARGR
jgi:hypothetical protein